MTDAMNPILFRDLRDVLDANRGGVGNGDDQRTLRHDPNRRLRTGIPEVIYAASKPPQAVAEALKQLATANGRALASRVAEDTVTTLRTLLEPTFEVEIFSLARGLVASIPGTQRVTLGGVVGVFLPELPISGGSREPPYRAPEMGARVLEAWEVGVAGIDRLIERLNGSMRRRERRRRPGWHGRSVAVGRWPGWSVPVIGLPTSVRFGFGAGASGSSAPCCGLAHRD